MKTTQLSFLLLLIVISLQISCQSEITPGDDPVSIDYVDSLSKQADRLKANSKIKEALHTNLRALRLIENRSDSTYARLLRQRIVLLGRKSPLDSVFHYCNTLLSLHQKNQDTSNIADAYYLKAFYFNKSQQLDSALSYSYQSLQLYKQLKDSTRVYGRSKMLALILKVQGNYEEAELIAIEGLNYLKPRPDNRQEFSDLYNEIGILTRNRDNFKEALYWYQKALELTNNKIYQNTIKNNIAVVYLKSLSYKKAYDILSEIKKDSLLNLPEHARAKSRILDNWAFAKSKLGHDDAETYLLEALEIRKQKSIAFVLNASYIHLAEHYLDRSDPRAVKMAENAYKTAKTYNNPGDQLKALSILIETAKNPRKYAILYRNINDSITTIRQQSKNHYAKIKYDVEHNRQENENLKAKAIIQELEVKKARFRNMMFALAVVLIFGSSLLIYRSQKRKHAKEKEFAAYQAELHISKKIHDEVANDVFNLITRIQNNPLTISFKDSLLEAVDKLYRKARNIARDYSDIVVDEEFENTLRELLSNYNNEQARVMSKGIKTIQWETLTANKKRTLYRILQELLVNMKKHSQASIVMVNFQKQGRYLIMTYSDNGMGITKENLENGHGIKNMEQRLAGIGGKINFDLRSTSGTKGAVSIPF